MQGSAGTAVHVFQVTGELQHGRDVQAALSSLSLPV
jgi:hypothetical protein